MKEVQQRDHDVPPLVRVPPDVEPPRAHRSGILNTKTAAAAASPTKSAAIRQPRSTTSGDDAPCSSTQCTQGSSPPAPMATKSVIRIRAAVGEWNCGRVCAPAAPAAISATSATYTYCTSGVHTKPYASPGMYAPQMMTATPT
eukprot:Amastigsp_a197671_3.p2 type:complete len:143 gc:universal Amastigsp_a197671_3:700-272(-)